MQKSRLVRLMVHLVPFTALGLVACGSDGSSGKPAGTGGSGEQTDGGGSGGNQTTGSGGSNNGGSESGGATGSGGNSNGGAGTGGATGSGGSAGSTGDPPALSGDGIAWTWNGTNYLADKNQAGGFSFSYITVNFDTGEPPIAAHQFYFSGVPNSPPGKYQCKDMQSANGVSLDWLLYDTTKNPPNPHYAWDPKTLPCEIEVLKADSGSNPGDVFEATFKVDLHCVYPDETRSVVGRVHITKK